MGILYPIGILLALAIVVVVTHPFAALIHELGHAITALLMTKGKVTIYVGTATDDPKGLPLRLGRLEAWLNYRPFSSWGGYCKADFTGQPRYKTSIYVLSGAIFELAIAILLCYFSFHYDTHSALKMVAVLFLVFSIFMLWANLDPFERHRSKEGGNLHLNDGFYLRQLIYAQRYPKYLAQLRELMAQKRWADAAYLAEKLLRYRIVNAEIYRNAIFAQINLQRFTHAQALSDAYLKKYSGNANDYTHAGYILSSLHLHAEAMLAYEKATALDPKHHVILSNIAFTHQSLTQYAEAIVVYDQVLLIEPTYAYAYSNRGLCKIKLGQVDDGLQDIAQAITLDPKDAYAFRSKGIYHLGRGERAEALTQFEQAKRYYAQTFDIDALILEAGGNSQVANRSSSRKS